MPESKFKLGDYVEVKDRIAQFYRTYPNGRLFTKQIQLSNEPDNVPRVLVEACAYRTADDPIPGVGWSWMELPGKTPYTRGSELENTETSAWGRAIGALGIGIDRSIASRQEVDNKKSDDAGPVYETSLEPTHANGLIGTVEAGKPPVDLQVRQTPDGPAWGFKLKNGRKSYQVLATGDLASVIGVVLGDESLEGVRVEVFGSIDMIPWDKAGKAMPPYPRINLTKLKTPDWTLPLSPLREDEPEQVSPVENGVDSDYVDTVPLAPGQEVLPLDDEERALVGGVG